MSSPSAAHASAGGCADSEAKSLQLPPLPASPTAPGAPLMAAGAHNAPSSSPFGVSVEQLSDMFAPQKDASKLDALGGVLALCSALAVDPAVGIVHHGTGFNPATIADAADVLLDPSGPETADSLKEFARSSSLIIPQTALPLPLPSSDDLSSSQGPPQPARSSSFTRASAAGNVKNALPLASTAIDLTTPEILAKADHDARVASFGANRLPQAKEPNFFYYIRESLTDKMLQLLCVSAAISLGIELLKATVLPSDSQSNNHQHGWVEGLAILVAVIVVVCVSSFSEWSKARQFRKLQASTEDVRVTVLRDGKNIVISAFSLLVGDVLVVQPGNIMPADGVFLSGHSVRCDESSATGETDAIKKGLGPGLDPLFLSGSVVLEGSANVLVTCVGVNSFHGKTMMSLSTPAQRTPLQDQLDALAENIAKLGFAIAVVMLISLVVQYLIIMLTYESTDETYKNHEINTSFLGVVQSLISLVTKTVAIVVVAVPEGLPLAVTLALSFATREMKREKNLVRVKAACEVLANATTVCSDKTGTLTENRMTVVRACFGGTVVGFDLREGSKPSTTNLADAADHKQEANANTETADGNLGKSEKLDSSAADVDGTARQTGMLTLRTLVKDSAYFEILNDAIALNCSAFLDVDQRTNTKVFIGSKTECAILEMQRRAGIDCDELRRRKIISHIYPFDSKNKWMATVVQIRNSSSEALSDACPHRVYVKGASEIVLAMCNSYYKLPEPQSGASESVGSVVPLDAAARAEIERKIDNYACDSLRTIVIAYREVDSLPAGYEDDSSELVSNFVFLGLVGIEDPLRPGVQDAVSSCQRAGIFVRMVTGDNVVTARAIATQAGILQKGGLVFEGPVFRKLPLAEMQRILPRLQVLARSSPMDKHLLVQTLMDMGEIVAVTGDGTNDAPALKLAHVGISMGISGTQVAQHASDIVLLTDNFSSIVRAVLWGRNVNDAIRKFLQFQLTVNIAAVVVNFIVNFFPQFKVLTVIQLLWVNLIMDSLAALAYATEAPHLRLLERHPEVRDAPLISVQMWKIILSGAALQIFIMLVSLFSLSASTEFTSPRDPTNSIFENMDATKMREMVVSTIVFNAFIFFQLFNEINCRILDQRVNVFDSLYKSRTFLLILGLSLVAQIFIVEFFGVVFSTAPLTIGQWALSVGLGMLVFPVALLMRKLPDKVFFWYTPKPTSRQFISRERLQWASAIEKVKAQLSVYRALRGNRVFQNE